MFSSDEGNTLERVAIKNITYFTVIHHETLHAAKYEVDDVYNTKEYYDRVEAGPDSRILSYSTQFLERVEAYFRIVAEK